MKPQPQNASTQYVEFAPTRTDPVLEQSGPASVAGSASAASASLGRDLPPVYLARCDVQLRYRWVNQAYAQRLGRTVAELIGHEVHEAIGTDMSGLLRPYLSRALLGQDTHVELELPAAGCGPRRSALAIFPEWDERGSISGMVVVEADVTELRRSEVSLYQREREFKTIVENSPDIIARLDRNARHLYINRAVEEPFGIPAAEFIGKSMADLRLPPEVAAAYANATAGVFDSGVERAFSFNLPVEGRIRHYTARAIPELDRNQVVESVLIITYDVTQRTEAHLERDALLVREKAARMQAEAAAKARDEFLAVVSHELRSPLNGIQSWTHVLENYVGSDSPPVLRALAGIKLGVQQQVRLIEDLLDATLIMTGKLGLSHKPVVVAGLVQEAIDQISTLADEKRIAIVASLNAKDQTVDGDAERIRQIVGNLLSNAIKFTPEGGHIWIRVSAQAPELTIEVRDDGRGIAPEFLPYLFDPFRQADGSSTRRAGGIGLGLTLVRRLTELHGGSVSAASAGENRGACFTVTLPLTGGAGAAPEGTPAIRVASSARLNSLQGRKIALVDDQREARDSLGQLLEHSGAAVRTFGSGLELVNYFRGISPTDRPDVLICDIAMPEQDGYVTLQQIRALERARPLEGRGELPAVALTAFSQREDKIRALANGFQVHLAKPVDPAELIDVLGALTEPRVATPANRTPKQQRAQR